MHLDSRNKISNFVKRKMLIIITYSSNFKNKHDEITWDCTFIPHLLRMRSESNMVATAHKYYIYVHNSRGFADELIFLFC